MAQKVIGFAISVLAVRLLTQETYGYITYAQSIIIVIKPFLGMGANQALIRYGAISDNHKKKRHLFFYALRNGLMLSGVLMIGTWLSIPLLTKNMPGASVFLMILSVQLITLLMFENVKGYLRVLRLNKPFAFAEAGFSLLLLILALGGIYLAGGVGYAWAIVLAPALIAIIFYLRLPKTLRQVNFQTPENIKGFWKYGFFAGLGVMASQLLYTIDIVLLGNLQPDSGMIAQYKVASILPFSLLLLPLAFINTDYVKIASESRNARFLKHYSLQYLLLFASVSLGIGGVLYFSAGFLLELLFGSAYKEGASLFRVFVLGLMGGMLFRVPFGNILSALGKANWNSVISVFILLLNIVLDYYLIKHYGAMGAAIATTSIIWLSGLLSCAAFLIYLRTLPKNPL